jgi:hypothetical protein
LREDPSLCVVSIYTRVQHGMMPSMHMFTSEACAPAARSVDAALPAGVPVERTTWLG